MLPTNAATEKLVETPENGASQAGQTEEILQGFSSQPRPTMQELAPTFLDDVINSTPKYDRGVAK